MHIATQDLDIAFRNGEVINPVERGHIAFRTDDIEAYKRHLDAHGVYYSDYGTTFAAEWHQLFFLDPEVRVSCSCRVRLYPLFWSRCLVLLAFISNRALLQGMVVEVHQTISSKTM
jgi:catechol 2,3-dioxygenase-like lactoylglutathione lyase family enzyme